MIDTFYFWIIVFFMMVGTLTIRGFIIAASAKVKIPARAQELFSYIPAAILPAFIVPSVVFHSGHVESLWGKERTLVLLLAGAVCYWTRSTLATIVFGLVALYFITQFI